MKLDRIVKKIYTSRKIILELLVDRGYPTENYNNYSINEISAMIKSGNNLESGTNPQPGPLDILLTREDGRKIYIKYRMSKSRITSTFKAFIEDIFTEHISKSDTLLLVIAEKNINTASVRKYINEEAYLGKGYFIQLFSVNELLFNRSKHEIVPKHRIISEKEKTQVMTKYNIMDIQNFPLIDRDDPIAKYYGVRPGDICKITTRSGISGTYIRYRCCISNA